MKFRKLISAWILAMGLGVVPPILAFQADDATKAVTKRAKKSEKETSDAASSAVAETSRKATSTPAKSVPESEIAAAKADGRVWVNTETGVYHKGGKWYGATKAGKFMTEQDAKKAGYRASKTK